MGGEYRGFDLFGPTSLGELIAGIKGYSGRLAFLAGGTDLLIELQKGRQKPQLVVDLSQVKELYGVQKEKDRLSIGSMTTFSRLSRESAVRARALCLAQAAGQIGSAQIRNRGTLGGNIASASPAGDSLPGLLVLEAQVTTLAPEGARRIPMDRILTGKGRTCLKPSEVITGIEIPSGGKHFLSGFEKIGSRSAVSIARLNMAVALNYEKTGKVIKDVRIAVGALGETAFRLRTVEQALEGQKLGPGLLRTWEEMLVEAVDGAITGRSSHPYKRVAVRGLARTMAANLWGSDPSLGGMFS
ncbi:FAD binding domain-containing protein [Desulfosporosinus sp. PR]|uniref:FAD binding domain-containing protein n=1 Tax=Candidatus Desulfosporosinus nitrosoreducens TaxID=3401928 RepID=UPI0027FB24A7|nr:FAD binding domain-containing protein [Desulfosporosinus sp. PR]MDQ7096340.1 FAD binding domain-containing protein [Desulfosporosinus sp. PR]